MKTGILGALALAAVTSGLAACNDAPPPPPAATPASSLSASNARLVLSAVKGNPAAAYFDVTNKSDKDWMIDSARLEGAQNTMLHMETNAPGTVGGMGELPAVSVPHGQTVQFEPGKLHVMVMDPPPTLAPGDKAKLTLRFPGGATMSFPLDVRAAGDRR